MASTDARPVPRKNTAFRAYFPILDADGDPVTGATALDSEASIDGASFADCTNEATEIGTSGIYYLDLTASEMNGDAVVVRVQTSSTGAKTTVLVFYPEEAGDVRANVVQVGGTTVDLTAFGVTSLGALSSGAAGSFTLPSGQRANVAVGQVIVVVGKGDGRVIATYNSATGAGTTDSNFDTAAAASDSYVVFAQAAATTTPPDVNVARISGDSTAADNLEAAADGTGYNLGGGSVVAASVTGAVGSVTGAVGSVTATVNANVTQLSGDSAAADNAEAFFDGTGYAGTGNVIPTVTTVTNAVAADVTKISGDTTAADNLEAALDGTGGVTLSATLSALSTTERNAVADALLDRNVAGGSSTGRKVKEALAFLRNKWAISGGTLTVYDTGDSTALFTATITTAAGDPVTTVDPA